MNSLTELRARIGVHRGAGRAIIIPMSTVPQFAVLDPMPKSTISTAVAAQTVASESAWRQIIRRDPQAQFFYGVTTTGVFCRPQCTSRRPLRANVRFFSTAAEAQSAGFRACKRCHPTTTAWSSLSDETRSNPLDVVRAYIEAHLDRQVPLTELGRVAGMSPFTVQRLFKRQMGVSPLQYQRALKAGRLRGALKQGDSVTNAIYSAGFGSSSRAYEANQLGMTPARFAQGGKGERIGWASAPSPFGWIIVGGTDRGLCWLSLAGTKAEAEAGLREEFPAAELHFAPSLLRWVETAVESVSSEANLVQKAAAPQVPAAQQSLDLRGTVFQLRVWQALRQIPRGQTRSYSQLARELGDPKATRAVARACATNRVALVVPCHRVVGADGSLTGYRWGVERKKKLLEAEKKQA